ncbi:MAG: type III pantothenate kinase [Bacteroidota bacterium]
MLLAIDIGNTEVTLGLFEGRKLVRSYRVSSETRRTADEAALLLRQIAPELAGTNGAAERTEKARGAKRAVGAEHACVIASVVPPQTAIFAEAVKQLLGRAPLEISAASAPWLKIEYRDPGAVGADRIANAVAVIERHGTPAVVVDFGTATTFDVISKDGRYLGGVIAPGVLTGAENLVRRAARLGAFEIKEPERVVGRSTEESLQSGLLYGAVGQVDAIVRRIAAEARMRPVVIATGGLAKAIAPHSKTIQKVDANLTLHGLRMIRERMGVKPGRA